MDVLDYSYELMRLIFLSGAVFGLLYKKRYGVTPGGIIVPGTLAIELGSSLKAFSISILTAVICYFLHKYTFGRYALSKRQSNYIFIAYSVCINIALTLLLGKRHWISTEIGTISLISSGLIAISAHKYRLGTVLRGTLSVTALTYLVGLTLASFVPFHLLSQTTIQLGSYVRLGFLHAAIFFPLSLLASYTIYRKMNTKLFGYLLLPYIVVMLTSSLLQAALISAAIYVNYYFVKYVMERTLIIGLERFVISLFGSYFFISLLDWIAIQTKVHGYRPSPLAALVVVTVATNSLVLSIPRLHLRRADFSIAQKMLQMSTGTVAAYIRRAAANGLSRWNAANWASLSHRLSVTTKQSLHLRRPAWLKEQL
ncbi:MAG: poly-gamma-glutamate biosynthesis protein PgsC/CapC [Candidatus Saccharimonadales bacterium]